jgi:hypothetical protein
MDLFQTDESAPLPSTSLIRFSIYRQGISQSMGQYLKITDKLDRFQNAAKKLEQLSRISIGQPYFH